MVVVIVDASLVIVQSAHQLLLILSEHLKFIFHFVSYLIELLCEWLSLFGYMFTAFLVPDLITKGRHWFLPLLELHGSHLTLRITISAYVALARILEKILMRWELFQTGTRNQLNSWVLDNLFLTFEMLIDLAIRFRVCGAAMSRLLLLLLVIDIIIFIIFIILEVVVVLAHLAAIVVLWSVSTDDLLMRSLRHVNFL